MIAENGEFLKGGVYDMMHRRKRRPAEAFDTGVKGLPFRARIQMRRRLMFKRKLSAAALWIRVLRRSVINRLISREVSATKAKLKGSPGWNSLFKHLPFAPKTGAAETYYIHSAYITSASCNDPSRGSGGFHHSSVSYWPFTANNTGR